MSTNQPEAGKRKPVDFATQGLQDATATGNFVDDSGVAGLPSRVFEDTSAKEAAKGAAAFEGSFTTQESPGLQRKKSLKTEVN